MPPPVESGAICGRLLFCGREMIQPVLLLSEKRINLFYKSDKFCGVLFNRCLFTEDLPTFFVFALHSETL